MEPLSLVINTAEKHTQFVILKNNSLFCSFNFAAKASGTEILMPSVEYACERLGIAPADFSRLVCVAGPGNFTGIRIGITTCSGIGRALNIPQAPLDYLLCIALNCRIPNKNILIMTNAKKELAYGALFRTDSQGIPIKAGNTFLFDFSKENNQIPLIPDYAFGSAVTDHRDFLRDFLPDKTVMEDSAYNYPSEISLVKAVSLIPEEAYTFDDINPIYLRDCDAVENLDQIAVKLGRTPSLVRKEMKELMQKEI